eukprot:CAMPEP_0182478544 /NCGR_PEP_ID=MMETSP1319-20130603/32651_1 /TAXON_ID=172717 /ORGANISM="Bolidomonas pacifica, Strain RCC208" /LENGTH=53 /DNA_ID=CAMNT_0024679891 /DNA_START=107 /DNA_END=265 /DNA_ORIENTATION=+
MDSLGISWSAIVAISDNSRDLSGAHNAMSSGLMSIIRATRCLMAANESDGSTW